jgi:tartrate dehydratase alpha subunit/fumarate hydratase class I-like protein
MPKEFDSCMANGGRVITKRVNDKEYMHICYPKGGGPSIAGETKQYKKVSSFKKT